MSIQYQHFVVYGIVLYAAFKLFFPIFELIYKKIVPKKHKKTEKLCFEAVCARCSVKD